LGGCGATEDGSGLVDGKSKRFSAWGKVEIVLRLLRSEDLELLSRQLAVNTD